MKKTVNVEKLSRSDIDTDRLQEAALLLISELAGRAVDDLSNTMESARDGESNDHEAKDRKRRDALAAVYRALKAVPPRAEKWRHRGA